MALVLISCNLNILKIYSYLFISFVIYLFLTLSFRIDGVDYDNYIAIYNSPFDMEWDFGFSIIVTIFKFATQLNLEYFYLAIPFFGLMSFYFVSKILKIDFLYTYFFYIIAFGFTRDLVQIRISIAMYVIIFAIYSLRSTRFKSAFFLAAASIHLTSIVFIVNFYISKYFVKKKKIIYFIIFLLALPFASSILMAAVGSIDPRLLIYSNWNEDAIGAPISNFSGLFLIIMVLIIALYNYFLSNKDNFDYLAVCMSIFTLFIYFSFLDISIVASRLSNVSLSALPIIFSRNILLIHSCKNINIKLWVSFSMFIFCTLIILRPGNSAIVNQIKFAVNF